jgi:uncharacterized protein YegJ (DUF2314 family)
MAYVVLVAVIAAAAWVAWWWFVARNRPIVPPLTMSDDDPLLIEAIAKAKSSIDQFRKLAESPNSAPQVKIPFFSNAGETEFLWAEVRRFGVEDLDVLYLTPPVTHTGRLERIHTHPISDVVDWVAKLPSGKLAGGFSMRVMFQRGREQWGSLPPRLEVEERKYGDV